jgi:hypothetical protein
MQTALRADDRVYRTPGARPETSYKAEQAKKNRRGRVPTTPGWTILVDLMPLRVYLRLNITVCSKSMGRIVSEARQVNSWGWKIVTVSRHQTEGLPEVLYALRASRASPEEQHVSVPGVQHMR